MKKGEEGGLESKEDLSNVLRIFQEAKIAIKSDNWMKLKDLSNETLHSAAVHQDTLNIITAVLVYALSKVLQRDSYKRMRGWDIFYKKLLGYLDEVIIALKKGDAKAAILAEGKIRESLNEISGDLAMYIKDIFRKAEINKAFKLYEHGLTAQSTADLLGVSLWDLSTYIGQSSISEANVSQSLPVKERLKYAEDIFA
jgi:hypothetical protein